MDITQTADTHWFHVFRSMVEHGELANISGSALKVYLVIKSHANFNSGASFPSEQTISIKSGLSISQVKRCVKELQQLAYIVTEKIGRKNHYVLREKLVIHDLFGNSAAEATWDYVPKLVGDAVDEVKKYVQFSSVENTQIIKIENLQININNVADGGVVINNQAIDLSKFDPKMQETIKKFAEKGGLKITENTESYTQLMGDTCLG